MVNMTTYIKNTLLLCLMFCATIFVGCSDDDNNGVTPLPEGQGEVTFKFVRNKVYTISTLEDMARLKVTLEKDGQKVTLPTIDLIGDIDSLTSSAVRLENGDYKVVKYTAYNNKGVQVQEAYLDDNNTLSVEHGVMQTFYFPVSIRFVYINNEIRNMLFGVCAEALGNDSTKWPKSWRVENEDLLTWENLEFEVDDYGEISYLACIIFDGKTFPGMKKLPATVSLFPTLEGIQIMDIPEFEELPDNMDKSPLYSIMIMNTGFKAFPKNFEKMKNLRSLSVINSKLTELPIRLSELPEVRDVEISGNEIAEFPKELAEKWQKVVSLRMNYTKLTSLPENIFGMKKVSTFDFCDNQGLSNLPKYRGDNTYMGGLFLDNCSFTSIPEIANTRMRTLSLANNKITSVSQEVVNGLSDQLLTLILDDNKINSFPQMASSSLIELSLDNCGLTAIPDLSKLPELCVLSLNSNQILEVKDGTFTNCTKFAILDLSKNTELRTFSNHAGFTVIDQTVKYRNKKLVGDKVVEYGDEQTQNIAKPYYLNCVNVDDCPNLTWEVPETWCCIKNFYVWNKEELELPVRNVIVYNRGSKNVVRHECPVCKVDGQPRVYSFPKTLEEIIAGLKKNQDK